MVMLKYSNYSPTKPNVLFLSDYTGNKIGQYQDTQFKNNQLYKISKLGEGFKNSYNTAMNFFKEWASCRERTLERLSSAIQFMKQVQLHTNKRICTLSLVGLIGSVISLVLVDENQSIGLKLFKGSAVLVYLSYACFIYEDIVCKKEVKNIVEVIRKDIFLSSQLKNKLLLGAVYKDMYSSFANKLNYSFLYKMNVPQHRANCYEDFNLLFYYCGPSDSNDMFSPSVVRTDVPHTPELLQDSTIIDIVQKYVRHTLEGTESYRFKNQCLSIEKMTQLNCLISPSSRCEVSFTPLLTLLFTLFLDNFNAAALVMFVNFYIFYNTFLNLCVENKIEECQVFYNLQQICYIEYNQLMEFYNHPSLKIDTLKNESKLYSFP